MPHPHPGPHKEGFFTSKECNSQIGIHTQKMPAQASKDGIKRRWSKSKTQGKIICMNEQLLKPVLNHRYLFIRSALFMSS
jgi:hypothetical protein